MPHELPGQVAQINPLPPPIPEHDVLIDPQHRKDKLHIFIVVLDDDVYPWEKCALHDLPFDAVVLGRQVAHRQDDILQYLDVIGGYSQVDQDIPTLDELHHQLGVELLQRGYVGQQFSYRQGVLAGCVKG